MSGPDASSDEYRAGYLAGQADRQGEVDWLENEADRYYRAAYGDERRLAAYAVTRAELEQRRALSEPPVEVTRRDALASWGIETEAPEQDTQSASPSTSTGRPTNRTSRSPNEYVKAVPSRSGSVGGHAVGSENGLSVAAGIEVRRDPLRSWQVAARQTKMSS